MDIFLIFCFVFQTACAEFGSALTICRALGQGELSGADASSASGEDGAEDLELRDFFTARAEHVIEPLLRYCRYELQEGGMDQSDLRSLLEEQEEVEKKLLKASFPKLSLKIPSALGSLRDEKRTDGASDDTNMSTVHFRSRDIAVESKGLQLDLVKIADLRQ